MFNLGELSKEAISIYLHYKLVKESIGALSYCEFF